MSPERSIQDIEKELAQTRERLAATVDELAFRATPQQIAKRQKESARAAFASATQRPDGSLRVEVVAGLVAVAVLFVAAGLRARRSS